MTDMFLTPDEIADRLAVFYEPELYWINQAYQVGLTWFVLLALNMWGVS